MYLLHVNTNVCKEINISKYKKFYLPFGNFIVYIKSICIIDDCNPSLFPIEPMVCKKCIEILKI